MNQSCCLNRTNVKSNYWKIPDESMNLTSMSINKNQGGNPILAISSGKSESNLFIYELNLFNNYLIHHHTISLPNIHAMKWINNTRYLVTGNNKGYAHLVSTPKLATHDVSILIVMATLITMMMMRMITIQQKSVNDSIIGNI